MNSVVSILVCALPLIVSANAGNQLMWRLLTRTSPSSLPVQQPNTTTQVSLLFYIQHLNMIEDEQMLELGGFMDITWKDEYMKWDPKDYGGIKFVRKHAIFFWKPDISVYNGHISEFGLNGNTQQQYLRISYPGYVSWLPNVVTYSYCSLDHANYPFDQQTCKVKLGSWTYTREQLDLVTLTNKNNESASTRFEAFHDVNPKWEVAKVTETRNVVTLGDDSYIYILVSLDLKRRLTLYEATLLAPISVAACLVIVTFLLYPWHDHKIVTGLLAIVLLIAVTFQLTWTLPKMTTVPKIVNVCRSCLIAACSSVFIAILLTNLSKGQYSFSKEPPAIVLNQLSGILGKVMCINGGLEAPVKPGSYQRSISADSMANYTENSSKDNLAGWKLIALALDRLMLVTFIVVLLAIMMG